MIYIAIAGLGPRGLTVLERIVAHERIQKNFGHGDFAL